MFFSFIIMTTACAVIGYIAYTSVTAEQIAQATPEGWDNLFFGWNLNINWRRNFACSQ
jgi:hypothetical protein